MHILLPLMFHFTQLILFPRILCNIMHLVLIPYLPSFLFFKLLLFTKIKKSGVNVILISLTLQNNLLQIIVVHKNKKIWCQCDFDLIDSSKQFTSMSIVQQATSLIKTASRISVHLIRKIKIE